MFDTVQNIKFATERLIIKNPSMEDFPEVLKMKCDREVKKFTGGTSTLSYEEEMSNYFKRVNTFGLNNNYIFSVIEKKSCAFIGYCGFQFCDIVDGIEIVFGFKKTSWGNGYGKEAAMNVLSYGFEHLQLKEVFAAVN